MAECRAAADLYLSKGLARSTAKSYASDVKQYINFCSRSGRSPLPVVEDVMSAFVAMLANCYASIRTYL